VDRVGERWQTWAASLKEGLRAPFLGKESAVSAKVHTPLSIVLPQHAKVLRCGMLGFGTSHPHPKCGACECWKGHTNKACSITSAYSLLHECLRRVEYHLTNTWISWWTPHHREHSLENASPSKDSERIVANGSLPASVRWLHTGEPFEFSSETASPPSGLCWILSHR